MRGLLQEAALLLEKNKSALLNTSRERKDPHGGTVHGFFKPSASRRAVGAACHQAPKSLIGNRVRNPSSTSPRRAG